MPRPRVVYADSTYRADCPHDDVFSFAPFELRVVSRPPGAEGFVRLPEIEMKAVIRGVDDRDRRQIGVVLTKQRGKGTDAISPTIVPVGIEDDEAALMQVDADQ